MTAITLILIPLLPLLSFLILGLGFRRIQRKTAIFAATVPVFLSLILSLTLFLSLDLKSETSLFTYFYWINTGSIAIPFALLYDPLSALMLLIVTGVGFLIFVYSVGYMKEDPGFNRFFSYMNLFVFFMLILVLGANYPIMFIGWEGVGLCSYLLIGFWFRNHEFNNAAKKAFIMNRIGDLGFLLGMFLLFTTFGTLDYMGIFSQAKSFPAGHATLTAITLLLFMGAVGKSAQIPLFTWLPDAMAGPTPVSALIHAATMVTAGIYMILRSNVLFVLSPLTMSVIGITALTTALLTASIALFQNDIKKVLAYSTVSQLGYMFAGISVGAFTGAMFHLTTHAFFKALLFLGAGSVIHATAGEQDIRLMGGLRKTMPKTYLTFLVATLAIAGIPPLSGFFSKDEILVHVFEANPFWWILLVAGALMTTFYMSRLLFLVFFNQYRGNGHQSHHLHESPPVMTIPLMILAFLAFTGGALNIPALFGGSAWLQGFLAPVFQDSMNLVTHHGSLSHSTEWIILGVTLAAVIFVVLWAWNYFVIRQKGVTPDGEKRPGFIHLLQKKYYIDEIYDRVCIRPVLWLSGSFHQVIETKMIDRVVESTGRAAVMAGNMIRYVQTGNVGFYMFMMVLGIILVLFLNILL